MGYDLLGDDEDNVVARGQTIGLPAGRYGRLGLLAAASFGPAGGAATIRYTDGFAQTSVLRAADWVKGSRGALRADFRVDETVEQDVGVSIYALTVPLDPAREVAAITLPVTAVPAESIPSLHVFALTLIPV